MSIAILTCFLLRIISGIFFSDIGSSFFWEYGELAKNVIAGKGYSLFYFSGDDINFMFNQNVLPFPSAYMPPGFTAFLLPFFLIGNAVLRDVLVMTSLSIVSCFVVYFIYKFTEQIFSKRTAIIAALIYALFPQFIYAAARTGNTIFFHLLITLILFMLYNHKVNKSNLKKIILLGFLMGFTIYFRTEFIFFIAIIIFAMLLKKEFRNAFVILLVIIVMIAPWQARNYSVFNKIGIFSTSSGQNLYRGHNPYRPGVWQDEEIQQKLARLKYSKNFEIKANDLFLDYAVKSIVANPGLEITNSAIKLFHLWFFNPNDERTTNTLYLIFWFFLLAACVFGLYKTCSWRRHKFLYLFLIYYSLLVIIFFALPRYQIMMQVVLIPFAAYGIEKIYKLKQIVKTFRNKDLLI